MGDLRRDYEYCATLTQRFWLRWMKGYLPCLQGRNKWKTLMDNLEVGQLVVVDQTKQGAYGLGRIHCIHPETRKGRRRPYGLGRIHCIHPETRKGREIVRHATVAVLAKNSDTGSCEIKYILRDLQKIAPV